MGTEIARRCSMRYMHLSTGALEAAIRLLETTPRRVDGEMLEQPR